MQVKSEKPKGLPVLSLAGASAGYRLLVLQQEVNDSKSHTGIRQESAAGQSASVEGSAPAGNTAAQTYDERHAEKNNELASENIRLKTKLMTVEKENLRLQRVIDEDRIYPTKDISTAASGVRPPAGLKSMEQSLHSLKAMLRDAKKELEEVKDENGKIKKSVKYTRINELEQEKKSTQ